MNKKIILVLLLCLFTLTLTFSGCSKEQLIENYQGQIETQDNPKEEIVTDIKTISTSENISEKINNVSSDIVEESDKTIDNVNIETKEELLDIAQEQIFG